MLEIELIPDLTHCVETMAKREYSEAMRRLLTAGEGIEELQERLELLRMFLETADFKGLRRESERHLVQGKKVKCVVYLEAGDPKCDLQVS